MVPEAQSFCSHIESSGKADVAKVDRDQWFGRHKGRQLHEYESLLGISIERRLGHEDFWIDLGTDPHASAMGQLAGTHKASFLGVSSLKVLAHPNVQTVTCEVPNEVARLQPFVGQATLITDVFGPTSYADDPIAVMLSCLPLLGQNGEFRIVTECERLDAQILHRLRPFLRQHLAVDFDPEVLQHEGKYTGTIDPHLRITLRLARSLQSESTAILSKARDYFGVPVPGKVLWTSDCGSAEIRQIEYSSF